MNWAQASARVIDALHQPHFPATLIEAIRNVVPFEHTVTFAYCGNRRPIALHSEFPVWKHKVMVADSQEGPYLLDPFYLQSSRTGDPRLVRLRDMAPDRFYQGEYFRNYYVQTELAEEIGFMLNIEPNVGIVISAMRTSKPFSAHEFRKLGNWFRSSVRSDGTIGQICQSNSPRPRSQRKQIIFQRSSSMHFAIWDVRF